MGRWRGALSLGAVVALIAGFPVAADGETQVSYSSSTHTVTIQEKPCAGTDTNCINDRMFFEVTKQDQDSGIAATIVEQQHTGDSAITAGNTACSRDIIANSVTCPATDIPTAVTVRTGEGNDDVHIRNFEGINCIPLDPPRYPIIDVTADMGAGDDTFTANITNAGPNGDPGCPGTGNFYDNFYETRLNANGGPGRDTLLGGRPGATLNGGDDADTLQGGPGGDVLIGGKGPDIISGNLGFNTVSYEASTNPVNVSLNGGGRDGEVTANGGSEGDDVSNVQKVIGGSGNDTLDGSRRSDHLELNGGPGNDTLIGGSGPDNLDGGNGFDTVSYEAGAFVVVVTVGTTGSFTGNDGPFVNGVSQGDDVPSNVEKVIGGTAGDTIVGNDDSQHFIGNRGNDTLTGKGGKDTLEGGPGTDTIDGGPGPDIITAGDDPDKVLVNDGEADKVSCGNARDTVTADLADKNAGTILADCEDVDFQAVDDGPPSHASVRALRITGATTAVSVTCPSEARIDCRGNLTLDDPKHRATVLASAPYSIPTGETSAVKLTLRGSAADLLSDRGQAIVQTDEPGVSQKGPRESIRLISVVRSTSTLVWRYVVLGVVLVLLVGGGALLVRRRRAATRA